MVAEAKGVGSAAATKLSAFVPMMSTPVGQFMFERLFERQVGVIE
jgi:hypothetical protein